MQMYYTDGKELLKTIYVLRPDITDTILTKFVSSFGALPNSEYERLVKRIANLLLFCGENLDFLYQNFYSEEYDGFSEFLENELEFEKELVQRIKEDRGKDECLWRITVSNHETYNFMTLFDNQNWEEESIFNRINHVLSRCIE